VLLTGVFRLLVGFEMRLLVELECAQQTHDLAGDFRGKWRPTRLRGPDGVQQLRWRRALEQVSVSAVADGGEDAGAIKLAVICASWLRPPALWTI
jgi:hypothetical protein